MTTRRIDELRPHPLNTEIYGDPGSAELVASIKANGILTPLLITGINAEIGANFIISGHRRYYAAKSVGLQVVPVVESMLMDSVDIQEAVIVANQQRIKTNEQIGREYQKLIDIESEKAKRRMAVESANKDNVSGRQNFAYLKNNQDSGKARDVIGRKIGKSGYSAEKAGKTVIVIDDLLSQGEAEQAEEIKKALDKSVNAGYTLAKSHIAETESAARQVQNISTFNATNDNIEWAKWSWNPVTGCKHGCPYCYARDIAMRYTGHFNPEFHPDRLSAPHNTKIPANRKNEPGINNVFVCSMADLFGDWVPREWIESVMAEIEKAPQWNFILLTKNPKRYLTVTVPQNCWIGATGDTVDRASAALVIFDELKSRGIKNVLFLSCEPLSERIRIINPTSATVPIDWLIVGGRSKSSKMPAFQPDWEWVERLLLDARACKVPVYFKPNLTAQPKEYPNK